MSENIEEIHGETCPVCFQKTLTLREQVMDIPYFGITHLFSMECSGCDYSMSDLEAEEERKPIKQSFTIETEADLNARVVKSASATIKIPRIATIESGANSDGYVTNVQGVLERVKKVIEELTEDDDKEIAKKAKNQLKKIQRVLWGREIVTITIQDPTGNSAIISDKTQ